MFRGYDGTLQAQCTNTVSLEGILVLFFLLICNSCFQLRELVLAPAEFSHKFLQFELRAQFLKVFNCLVMWTPPIFFLRYLKAFKEYLLVPGGSLKHCSLVCQHTEWQGGVKECDIIDMKQGVSSDCISQ